jgi:hypothetical protein
MRQLGHAGAFLRDDLLPHDAYHILRPFNIHTMFTRQPFTIPNNHHSTAVGTDSTLLKY